jgi:hypothetical protein
LNVISFHKSKAVLNAPQFLAALLRFQDLL